MSTFPIAALERQIEEQRDILSGNAPGASRLAELEIEKLELWLTNERRAEASRQAGIREREAESRKREADERADLEAQLKADYIAASPGTTQAEAEAALPDLMHRHRLAQLDQYEADVALARSRVRI